VKLEKFFGFKQFSKRSTEKRERQRSNMAERETKRDLAFITDHHRLVPPVLAISNCATATQSQPLPVKATEKRERRRETQIRHGGERNIERPRDGVVREIRR
jgi:hypothetical protein